MTLLIQYQWDSDIFYFEVKKLIVEQILTNIEDMEKEEIIKRHIEKVYLESAHLVKRIQRVTTDHGKEIGIRLKEPRDLVAGDVLHMDDKNLIMIDVLSDDLLVIQPRSLIGNGNYRPSIRKSPSSRSIRRKRYACSV